MKRKILFVLSVLLIVCFGVSSAVQAQAPITTRGMHDQLANKSSSYKSNPYSIIGNTVTMAPEPLPYKVYLPTVMNGSTSPVLTYGWVTTSSPTTKQLNAIKMSGGNGWIVGNQGTILAWNGNSWLTVTSPTTNDLQAVTIISQNDAWSVGKAGTILHWNGTDWSIVSSPTLNTLESISMISASDGWAVGDGGVILHWNGAIWANYSSPTDYDLNSVVLLSPDNGWAVGGKWFDPIIWFHDAILHWNGSSWASYPHTDGKDMLESLSFSSIKSGWASGDNNLRTVWNGTTWQPNHPSAGALTVSYDVSAVSSSDVWMVGWSYSTTEPLNIIHWNGIAWSYSSNPSSPSNVFYGVWFNSSTDGWAVGDNGVLVHYTSR